MCNSCGHEHKNEITANSTPKQGLFDLLNKKQALVFGLVEGFLVLCTIGFFILLAIMLSGGISSGAGTVKAPKLFGKCLESAKFASKVNTDRQMGESLGIAGTPALFINGYLIGGNYPYAAVKGVIDALLAGQTPEWDETKYGKLERVDMPELADAMWRGNKDAKVALVEFSDFECTYCAKFYSTIEQILSEYGEKIKFTYLHSPLSQIHPNAQKAAEAFECAKEQGRGWEMYDKLFTLSGKKDASGQTLLSLDTIKQAANELKLK